MIEPSTMMLRTAKDLEQNALAFIEDLETVWGKHDAEVQKRLNDMDGALKSMQFTIDMIRKAVDRLNYLHTVERRRFLKVVKRETPDPALSDQQCCANGRNPVSEAGKKAKIPESYHG